MRVLLIEDDSATAQSIELMLKADGFNVYTTDLGEEGVDLGKLYDYDIILLDLNLPDMPGFDVLKTLRSGAAEVSAFIRGLSDEQLDRKSALPLAGADVTLEQLLLSGILIQHVETDHLPAIKAAL